MKIAIMQPYLFPYIGYFQLIYASDIFVIYDDVNWINRGWINRNQILVNQKKYAFTFPCKDVSQNKLINEIELYYNEKFLNKFLQTITLAYKKAPYFEVIFPAFSDLLLKSIKDITISQFAYKTTLWVLNYLEIQKEIRFSSVNYSESKGLEKADRLIAICKKSKCRQYINAIGGQNLYDKDFFLKEGVFLHFLKSKPIDYKQFNNQFVPWLSIIDVLMFNDKKAIQIFLEQFELI